MKTRIIALLAVFTLSGCATVQEWDKAVGAAIADFSKPAEYSQADVGRVQNSNIRALPGGNIAYAKQGNERKATSAELAYAQKSNDDWNAMVKRDREERAAMEANPAKHKMSPEQSCAVVAELVNAQARQQAFETGDYKLLETHSKTKVFKACMKEQK